MDLILFGSSGHAGVIVDAIEALGLHRVIGYLDDTQERASMKRGYPVLGGFSDWRKFQAGFVLAFGDNFARMNLSIDGKFPVIIHPSATVSRTAQIGDGTVILSNAHVGPGCEVGRFCIVNTSASLDHDSTMKDFSSLGPGTVTGGLVQIGECSATGVGAMLSDRVSIGAHSVVGTGSIAVRNIPDHVIAYGNPARVMRQREKGEAYVARNRELN
jgi:sugar O-acyltransferase (sialic acid O-acetyltransferase NeuD family)